MWSSVDLPTPDAPMIATVSPGLTVRLTPFKTRTVSGPIRYSRSRSRAASRGSLIAQHLDGIQPGRAPGRREGGEQRDHERRADDEREVAARQLHRQVADLVDVAGEADDPVGVLDPDQQQAEGAPRHRPHDADQHAGHQEYASDAASRGAHGLEDADLL